MTTVNNEEFLNKLVEVVYKLSNIAKQQSYRLKSKWEEYLKPIKDTPYLVRDIPLDKKKFIEDIDYRIQVLKTVEQAVVDGFYAIKAVLNTLYNSYFDSELFRSDFSDDDQLILKYLVAKEILGNLIQYNKMDHDSVPLKYNIMGRNYYTMKLKSESANEILSNLEKLNIKNLKLVDLNEIMEEIKKDGIIDIKKQDEEYFYEIKRTLNLTPEGDRKYNNLLAPIVNWPTGFWRSFYNIRELNVTPDESCKYQDFLTKTLAKSATQGFGPTDYVFKNLIKYYEKIKEEGGS
ncbi:MAG: hypothetical protein ACFE8N_04860 [Promethearchaeota archaeon]